MRVSIPRGRAKTESSDIVDNGRGERSSMRVGGQGKHVKSVMERDLDVPRKLSASEISGTSDPGFCRRAFFNVERYSDIQ